MIYDKDIREPLFEFLEETYGTVRILEEKRIGSSRADVVMVTPNLLYGIEIKSDADSYVRLSRQIKDYDTFYDRNIVVVGSSHALHIREHIPEHWGVISVEPVDGILDFYILRQPAPNPNLSLLYKLSLLWRPELALLQEKNLMPKYQYKSKAFVIEKIAARVPDFLSRDTLDAQICELLMERDYTAIAETIREYKQKMHPEKKIRIRKKRRRRRKITFSTPS